MNVSYTTYVARLRGDYLEAFHRAEVYAVSLNLDEATLEDRMMELLDVLLTAQKNEKGVESVLGSDIDAFCEHFFSDAKWPGMGRKLLDMLRLILILVLCLVVFQLLIYAVVGQYPWERALTQPMNITGYLLGLAALLVGGGLLRFLLRPVLIRLKGMTAAAYNILILGLPLVLILAFSTGQNGFVRQHQVTLPLWSVLAVCAAGVLGLSVLRIAMRLRRFGGAGLTDHISILAGAAEKAKVEAPLQLRRRYERINRSRAKRGQSPMPAEEFSRRMERELRLSRWASPVLVLLVAALLLPTLVKTFTEAGLLAGLLHLLLLLAVELPILFLGWGSARSDREQAKLVHNARRLGIPLPEYLEQRLRSGNAAENPTE